MKILKFKKLSGGRYKVLFDSTELTLYEDVIINNNLLSIKEITLPDLEKIMNENIYYEVYNISLKLISYKLRTEKELKDSLEKKGFNIDVINDVIKRLKEQNYLNEEKYIEAYVNDKINLSNIGPYKIRKELIDLNLSMEKIDEYLSKIDEDIWDKKIDKIIKKRVTSMKNKSNNMIKLKLNEELFNLGYDKEKIEYFLNNLKLEDSDNLQSAYSKIYKKYEKKYEGENLKMHIRDYLYRRGYNLDDINNLLN